MIIMETGKKKVWVSIEKYDPLTGVSIRDIRTNDIVTSRGRSGTSTLLFSTTNGANTNLYPYILHAGCTSTGGFVIALMAGTTTLGIYGSDWYGNLNIVSTPDAPLGKIAASTTLSVEVIATPAANATINVAVVSKRVPLNSKIHT